VPTPGDGVTVGVGVRVRVRSDVLVQVICRSDAVVRRTRKTVALGYRVGHIKYINAIWQLE